MTAAPSECQLLDPPPVLAESVDLVRRGQQGDHAAIAEWWSAIRTACCAS